MTVKKLDFETKFVLVVFLLVVAGLIYSNYRKEQKIGELGSVIDAKNAKIAYYVNKLGEEVASKVVAEASLETLKITHKEELESITKRFNIKLRNLAAAATIETVTTDTVYVTKVVQDSVQNPVTTYSYEDNWISFELRDSEIGDPVFTWTAYDKIDIAASWKRRGLFKSKELYVDVVSSNPHVRVTGLNSLRVTNKKTPFGISFVAGYGIAGNGLSPFIGVGASYTIIRF